MSRYSLYVTPSAWREMKQLPGNMRQRIKRAVDALTDSPFVDVLGVRKRPPYDYSDLVQLVSDIT
jgi:mRNA interferase RelE/StbE